MPGQFVLQYYVDTSRRRLKGSIDLDQCEQVTRLDMHDPSAQFSHSWRRTLLGASRRFQPEEGPCKAFFVIVKTEGSRPDCVTAYGDSVFSLFSSPPILG